MKFRYFTLMCFVLATSLPSLILSQNNGQGQFVADQQGPPNFQSNSVSDGGQQMQANNQFKSVSGNQQVPFSPQFNSGFGSQQIPQNGQFNPGPNGQFFPQQQPSPWSALSGLLSQIPIASVVQMVMSFVQNSPFMYVLNSIFGKSVVTFQVLSLAYSFFAVISFFFPQMGTLLQQQIGSITNVLAPFSPSNLPGTIQSMQPMATTMNLVGINNPNCQVRAACESGQIIARNFPAAAQVFNVLGNVLPIEAAYQQPFLSGTNNVNCAAAYNSCPQSPIKALFNLNPLSSSQNSQNRKK